MPTTCKNCDTQFSGNYCNNCGQTADTHKMSWHYLWHDLQHAVLHFEKGILYTGKELFTRPGQSIREFLEGRRIKHIKPLSFLIILAGIHGFLFHYFEINMFSLESTPKHDSFMYNRAGDWITAHYALSLVLFLPFTSLASYLAFKKAGYNFSENLILNTYLACQQLLLRLLFFPLLIWFSGKTQIAFVLIVFSLFSFVFTFWTFGQFFNKLKFIESFLRTVLYYIILGVLMFASVQVAAMLMI